MYNIHAIIILILFDIPRLSANSLHQFQVAAAPRFRKSHAIDHDRTEAIVKQQSFDAALDAACVRYVCDEVCRTLSTVPSRQTYS